MSLKHSSLYYKIPQYGTAQSQTPVASLTKKYLLLVLGMVPRGHLLKWHSISCHHHHHNRLFNIFQHWPQLLWPGAIHLDWSFIPKMGFAHNINVPFSKSLMWVLTKHGHLQLRKSVTPKNRLPNPVAVSYRDLVAYIGLVSKEHIFLIASLKDSLNRYNEQIAVQMIE